MVYFSSWVEVDPDGRLCKVYLPKLTSTVSVELEKGYLTVTEDKKPPYIFRLAADSEQMEVVSCRTLSCFTMLTLSFGRISTLCLVERWPEFPLRYPINCRECGQTVVPPGRKAFLIPSLLWGLEEVRACEECAPMSHGTCKVRRTVHGERIYVGDHSLFLQVGDGVVPGDCKGCQRSMAQEVIPLTPFLSDLKVEGSWVNIRKFSIFSDHLSFLQAYTRLSELGGIVEKIFFDRGERVFRLLSTEGGLEIAVRVLGAPIEVRPVEGEHMPGEFSTRTVRCIRILASLERISTDPETVDCDFQVDHDQLVALLETLEKFPASDNLWPRISAWKLVYLPLPPDMDE